MLLSISSFVILFIAAFYFSYLLGQRKGELRPSLLKTLITVLNMLTGAAAGMISVQVFQYRLAPSLALAVIFTAAVSGLGGWRRGWLFAVWTSGFGSLAALAAVRLGMLFFSAPKIVFIVDLAFILILALLLKALAWLPVLQNQKPAGFKGKKEENKRAAARFILPLLSWGAAAVLLFFILINQDKITVGQLGLKKTQEAVFDEDNNVQTATIEVNSTGFNPQNTDFKKGDMLKAVLHVEPGSGGKLRLISKDLNIDAPLKDGDNLFMFNKPLPGVYRFSSGDGRFEGTFTVKN